MKPRSKSLFHYTSEFNYLIDILEHGFWPRYCLEDIAWLGFTGDTEIAFPMVCFCDIPLTRIQFHQKMYGSYGIGITRAWAAKNDVSPVRYVNSDSTVAELYKEIKDSAYKLGNPNERDALLEIQRKLTPWTKPSNGVMIRGSKEHRVDFYQESEWRHVPTFSYISNGNYSNPRIVDLKNQIMRSEHMLRFSFSDVKYIFLKDDSEIPRLFDELLRINSDRIDDTFKQLVSKIISIDQYFDDL